MRVLYLNPCGQMGGAETSLRELLASVRNAAPDWELVLVLGEDGPMAARGRELNVEVIIATLPPQLARIGDARQGKLAAAWALCQAFLPTAAYAWRLRRIIREKRPDIVHSNGFKMHLLGAWACPKTIPLIWHIHDYVGARQLMSRLLRLCQKACAAAIANSHSVAADLKALAPSLLVNTIYNAIDLDRFTPTGTKVDLDKLAGLPSASGLVRVGLIATFARWKGHEVFLRSLSMLPPDSPVRGYIIGGPIYQTAGSQWSVEELRQQVSSLGISGRVGFTGFLDDPAAAIRSLDIVVHASVEPEPFGMVIIEGMACGKPVIVAKAGGAAELLNDGENAVGYSPGDAAGLSSQISRLSFDDELRRRLGKAGRTEAERTYHGRRLGREMIALYSRVCGRAEEGLCQPAAGSREIAQAKIR